MGATVKQDLIHGWLSFNPRTRDGCDIVFAVNLKAANSFNPRTRDGCDFLNKSVVNVGEFQSTHP